MADRRLANVFLVLQELGKGTVKRFLRVLENQFQYSVMMTTRAQRPGEVDGGTISVLVKSLKS